MKDALDVPDWAYCGECGISHLHRTPICEPQTPRSLISDTELLFLIGFIFGF